MEEKEKFIICNHCNRFIKDKQDLVVAFDLFFMNAYHSECYAQRLKSSFFQGNNPVNGHVSNKITVILGLAGLLIVFTDFYAYTALIILQLGIRLYSWFKFERMLE
ncbi:hypothetical protein ABG79_00614 [Caloramator mitchellensis]|uniref:Uncharacterized protein n=1 Tax=Caloramator mitchellensis TaxID=908809 RepID=A0A0R3JWA1_CALMK|nr:hypothetical protein [Caloramator mitchellensis]KRQ87809.1 hypothetical protein ABG79_00614 [Caloramator mitchellensis]